MSSQTVKRSTAVISSLGEGVEKFLAEQIGSFAAMKALIMLMDAAPLALKTSEIAKDIHENRKAATVALEKLAAGELLFRQSGLFSDKWRYLKDNPQSMFIYSIRKLWQHPNTHKQVVNFLLQCEHRAKK